MVMKTLFIFMGDESKYGKSRQALFSHMQFSDFISFLLFSRIPHSTFFVLRDPSIVVLIIFLGYFLIIT